MADDSDRTALDNLYRLLAHGDLEAVREELFHLDEQAQRLLEMQLGEAGVQRLFLSARRGRRSQPKGRVILLHGIMGARLGTLAADQDETDIWISKYSLLRGRVERLALSPDGVAADSKWNVRVQGHMKADYLPMLLGLNQDWTAIPFAFDWRLDVDISARLLAERIKSWSEGQPVHLVAHSMGGLVSRRFIQLFPQLWKSMEDPNGHKRGGRLVMLGTPNFGSFAIPLALSGQEKLVRMLALLDCHHSLPALLEILNTFQGSYQMLPSPLVDLGDDHARLFDHREWGPLPVSQALLDRGRAFQEAMHEVTDPERLLYVAGYDQETPVGIRIVDRGEFQYRVTNEGDGRVPHKLGLLDGVKTLWIKESHGALAKNESVLAAIDELLTTGTSGELETERPEVRRARAPREEQRFRSAEYFERVPAEFEPAATRASARRGGRETKLTDEEAELLSSWLLSDYLGKPHSTRGGRGEETWEERKRTVGGTPAVTLHVHVVWGDVGSAKGDVFAVGHYQGVLPQNAELALDRVVSGSSQNLVLTGLTKRGVLRGSLGEIDFYPRADDPSKLVAVAGMGRPGTFGRPELRRLMRDLVWSVAALPRQRELATVLIGAGAGNLSLSAALEAMLAGVTNALSAANLLSPPRTLRIVEYNLAKAQEILAGLTKLAGRYPAIRLEPELEMGIGGGIGDEDGLSLALAAALQCAGKGGKPGQRKALETILSAVPKEHELQKRTKDWFVKLGPKEVEPLLSLASRLPVRLQRERKDEQRPSARISFSHDGKVFRIASIDDTAVVAEREVSIDKSLVSELVTKMTDPEPASVKNTSNLLYRLLVPRDLREVLRRDMSLVFEVDRTMARIHWEMMARDAEQHDNDPPLALQVEIARQLRTTYSPPPAFERPASGKLRALVIGDPGDPKEGDDLPGARREALQVVEILRRKGVDVTAMIGAPSARRGPALRDIPPAARIDVLNELMKGEYDLLHYAGHGDFDPRDPTRVGWVFQGGLLTAHELERVDRMPSLVVANACLSALTSQSIAGGKQLEDARHEAGLLPSLADEFFHRGVRNYVGTAWEVSDHGAVLFAERLYELLLPGTDGQEGATLGHAILEARKELSGRSTSFGALWAAYQHYGDPGFRFPAPAPERKSAPGTEMQVSKGPLPAPTRKPRTKSTASGAKRPRRIKS